MDDAPHLNVQTVAKRLGIPTATLRTWERRYGVGATYRTEGGHRRYSAADVRRLAEIIRLIGQGVPPGEAARFVGRSEPRRPQNSADPEHSPR